MITFISEYQYPFSILKPHSEKHYIKRVISTPFGGAWNKTDRWPTCFKDRERFYVLEDHGICKKTKSRISVTMHLLETYSHVSTECYWWLLFLQMCAEKMMSPLFLLEISREGEHIEEEPFCQALLCIYVDPKGPSFCTLSPCHGSIWWEFKRLHWEIRGIYRRLIGRVP